MAIIVVGAVLALVLLGGGSGSVTLGDTEKVTYNNIELLVPAGWESEEVGENTIYSTDLTYEDNEVAIVLTWDESEEGSLALLRTFIGSDEQDLIDLFTDPTAIDDELFDFSEMTGEVAEYSEDRIDATFRADVNGNGDLLNGQDGKWVARILATDADGFLSYQIVYLESSGVTDSDIETLLNGIEL